MNMRLSFVAITVIFLTLVLETAAAATVIIDLDQVYTDLAGSSCVDGPECVDIPAGGILVEDFILMSSPDSDKAVIYPSTTSLLAAIFLYTGTVSLAFDPTKARVSEIQFNGITTSSGLNVSVIGASVDSPFGSSPYNVTGVGDDYIVAIQGTDLTLMTVQALEADMQNITITYTVIPIPPSVWLFGSGLLGLAAIARRRARSS